MEKQELIDLLAESNNVINILTGANGSGKTYVLEQLENKIKEEDYVSIYRSHFIYNFDADLIRHPININKYKFNEEAIKRCADIITSLFPNIKYEFNDKKDYRDVFAFYHYNYITYRLCNIIYDLIKCKNEYFIIENIENGLHPSVQTKLMDIITILAIEGDNKIFIETHSDHIINALRVAVKQGVIDNESVMIYNFNLTDRDLTEIEAIGFRSDGKMNNRPNGFLDEWDKQLSKLII